MMVCFFVSEWSSTGYANDKIKYLEIPVEKDGQQVINVPDKKLETLIKKYTNIKEHEPILYKDISSVYELNEKQINNLSGLEHAYNLRQMRFSDGEIKDVSPLANLTQVQVLELPNQAIEDISPLEHLGKNVRQVIYQHQINLNNNNIKDLSPLKTWNNLHFLKVNNNPLEDISFLLQLNHLQNIEIKEVDLNKDDQYTLRDLVRKGVRVSYKDDLDSEEDIFFLDKNLERIIREELKITDRPVTAEDMKLLTQLDVSNKGIIKLEGLNYAVNLEKLDISSNEIANFNLSLPNLKELNISSTNIENLYSLGANPKLEILKASDLNTLWSMPKLPNIVEFDFYNSYMRDLKSISKNNYSTLKKVNLSEAYFLEQDLKEINRMKGEGIEVINGAPSTLQNGNRRLYLNDKADDYLKTIDELEMYSKTISLLFGSNEARYIQRDIPVQVSEDGRNYIDLTNIALAKDYEVVIKANNYSFKNKVNVLLAKPAITIESPTVIKGKLVDKDGLAVSKQRIYFSNLKFNQNTRTDANGNFQIITYNKDTFNISTHINRLNIKMEHINLNSLTTKHLDLGIYQLPNMDNYHKIHGVLVNENNEPIADARISLIDENGYVIKDYSSEEDGYFNIDGLENKSYTVKFYGESLGYKDLVVDMEPDATERAITLLNLNTDNPSEEEGNIIIPSTEVVAAGQHMNYIIKYRNNSKELMENPTINIVMTDKFEVLQNSIKVNGISAKNMNGTEIPLPPLKPGDFGEVRLTTLIKSKGLEPIKFTVELKEAQQVKHQMSKEIKKVIATIDTPTITTDKTLGLYGLAEPNAQITIIVNDQAMVTTKANAKLWMANVTLPVKGKNEIFDIKLKVVNDGVTYESPVYKFTYTIEPPNLTASSIYVANTRVPENPNVKLPTATNIIVLNKKYPSQDMDFYLTFDKPITNGYVEFLNSVYSLEEMHSTEGNYRYRVSIKGTWLAYQNQTVKLHYTSSEAQHIKPLLLVIPLIDPSGYVFEGSMENRLESVKTTVQQKVGSTWEDWQASQFGQVNPLYSDKNGRYGWDVVQGDWRVIFAKDGYETYTSRTVTVPPPETELNVPLISKRALDAEVELLDNYRVLIRFNRPVKEKDLSSLIRVVRQDTGKEVDGILMLQNWAGYKETALGVFEEDSTEKLSKEVIFSIITSDISIGDYTVIIDKEVTDYRGEKLKETKELSTAVKVVDKNHIFKITLSKDFDISTMYESIMVEDAQGNPLSIKLEKKGRAIHVLPPAGAYKNGAYTLKINDKLVGGANQKLTNPQKLLFSVH